MVASPRTSRVAFRRAVIASVAIHLAVAAALAILFRMQDQKPATTPGVDTGVDVVIRMFNDGPSPEARAPEAPATASPVEPIKPPGVPSEARPPLAGLAPQTLPAEVLAVISRSVASQHVAGSSPASSVLAIHGPLAPGKSVAYVLDCSGSMGEFGKLQLARATLLATVRNQPESVRFQLITYNSAARVLVPGGCVPATAANIETVGAKVLLQDAKGRSNHVEAVRVAIQSRPDVILLLTDAEDLALAQFRPLLASAGKPIAIYVAKVTPSTVGTPQELR